MRALLCVGLTLLVCESHGRSKPQGPGEAAADSGLDFKKITSQKKIESIHPVKAIHNIDELTKIEEIIPIDDDLAQKIKDEIQGGGGGGAVPAIGADEISNSEQSDSRASSQLSSTGSGGGSLEQKVQRLLDLFGIDDLDDIIKVTPINSMKKIDSMSAVSSGKSGDLLAGGAGGSESSASMDSLGSMGDEPLSGNDEGAGAVAQAGLSSSVQAGVAESPGGAQAGLGGAVQAGLAGGSTPSGKALTPEETEKLKELHKQLKYEQEARDIFNNMIKSLEDKIRTIEKVRDIHDAKEKDILKQIQEIQGAEGEPIGDSGARTVQAGFAQSDDSGSGANPLENGGSSLSVDYAKKIDSVDPLVKIKSMQKIKSILDLTDEQANKLKQWQLERNKSG